MPAHTHNKNAPDTGPNGFVHLGLELRRRTMAPIRHATFWFYIALGVVLFGGAGIWLEIIKYIYGSSGSNSASILTALVTFFPALIGSSSLQLVFQDTTKPLKAASMTWIIFFSILAIWLTLDHDILKSVAFPCAIIAFFSALWTWWLANADDTTFRDLLDPDGPVGGRTDQTLAGDLTDFKH